MGKQAERPRGAHPSWRACADAGVFRRRDGIQAPRRRVIEANYQPGAIGADEVRRTAPDQPEVRIGTGIAAFHVPWHTSTQNGCKSSLSIRA